MASPPKGSCTRHAIASIPAACPSAGPWLMTMMMLSSMVGLLVSWMEKNTTMTQVSTLKATKCPPTNSAMATTIQNKHWPGHSELALTTLRHLGEQKQRHKSKPEDSSATDEKTLKQET
uniref:Uncharacterized protein n=1 Tax=Oryza brachyantha TaxID=4533 RepID=J3LZ97_ORYBR